MWCRRDRALDGGVLAASDDGESHVGQRLRIVGRRGHPFCVCVFARSSQRCFRTWPRHMTLRWLAPEKGSSVSEDLVFASSQILRRKAGHRSAPRRCARAFTLLSWAWLEGNPCLGRFSESSSFGAELGDRKLKTQAQARLGRSHAPKPAHARAPAPAGHVLGGDRWLVPRRAAGRARLHHPGVPLRARRHAPVPHSAPP